MSTAAELASRRDTTKPITRAVMLWKEHGSIYEPEALERVYEVMKHDMLTSHRSQSEGRIRPSMIGKECPRMHVLSFAGFIQAVHSEEAVGFMDAGTWTHYQWQAMLLSSAMQGFGGLKDIEVPVEFAPWRLSGSIDGVQVDDSIFELKSVNAYKFSGSKDRVGIKNATQPPDLGHLQQVNGYMKAKEVAKASIVYVSRDNFNNFVEFRVEYDEALYLGTHTMISTAMKAYDEGILPPMLEGCAAIVTGTASSVGEEKRQRWETFFEQCSFSAICPRAIL